MKESIQPSELRIGNLLQDKVTKTVLKVTGLNENDIETYVIDRSKFPLQPGWSLEPIPLTEGWLLKFEFEKNDIYHTMYSKDKYILEESMMFDFDGIYNFRIRISAEESLYVNDLKHVHQLQNIYYPLTGVELADL